MANLITSRIEWSASLDPTKAQVPTEETKYHRKVCPSVIGAPQRLRHSSTRLSPSDVHYRNHWYACLATERCDLVSKRDRNAGPNVNNVEKLAELRRAGVNIGAFTPSDLHILVLMRITVHVSSSDELLPWRV